MRNKLFYLFGAAFLLCSICTFTSCSSVEEDSIEDVIDDEEDEEDDVLDLNGQYSSEDDYALKMTYNGEELTGKRATVFTDDNKTAIIELSGLEKDLSTLTSGLLEIKFTTYSPIPGEKEVILNNIKLTANKEGTAFTFKGEDRNATRTMTYTGTIQEEEMTIDITNELVNQKLAGTWKLQKPNLIVASSDKLTPLWYDWNTDLTIRFGLIDIPGMGELNIDTYTPNGLKDLLMMMGPMMANLFDAEQTVANLLQSITAQPNGCMFATYSYSGDLNNPEWSSEMSRNILRYHYGEENQIFIEANTDFIVGSLGGLLGAAARAADPGNTKLIGAKLVKALTPALEKGIPCTYKLDGNKMSVNIDEKLLLEVLQIIAELLNDEIANDFIMNFLSTDPTLAPYAPNIGIFIKRLPNLLKYTTESNKGVLSGECKFVKIGFHLEK